MQQTTLVELIHHEGYDDADAKFRQEMLQMAGAAVDGAIPYVEPSLEGPAVPSKRVVMRQTDPNEYERTRF